MPRPKQHHILWPHYERHDDGFVTTEVLAACDKPNAKERVELLTANVVRYFGPGWFVTPEGVRVDPQHVCMHCTKRVARASAGERAA